MKKIWRGTAFFLVLALCGTSADPVSHAAMAAVNREQGKKTGQAEQERDRTETVSLKRASEEITVDVFDERFAGESYENGKLVVGETENVSEVTVTPDQDSKGLFLSGDTGTVSKMRLDLGTFDFGNYTAGRLIVDGMVERRNNAVLSFYLDEEKESFARIELGRQKKKDSWVSTKFMCADVSGKKLTGSHKIYVEPKFSDAEGVTGKTGKTAKIFLKGILFSEGSTPVVDFRLDESLGSIAEMNGDMSHESECYGEMTLQVPEGYQSEYSDNTFQGGTYELDYIRGRGNSTWYSSKKPYKIKLMEKQNFFGMGSNKHWVLLANYYDYTMLRNKYTYWLGEKMGMEYTPQCVFVDVVMNGEYLGSYYLCEQVRVGKARVGIDDLEKEKDATDKNTISGGYLLSMGDDQNEQKMITTSHDYRFLIENPEFETYFNESQYNYIVNYLNQMEDAIYGSDFKNEDGVSYQEFLDVDAAINYYLVQEFSLNGDGYLSGSTYLYKKRNGKLFWGPLWDFDYVAWGATETQMHDVEGFIHNNRAPWMARLLQDEAFKEKLKKRWSEIREILLESIKEGGQIDQYAKQLYLSQKVNYQVTGGLLSDSRNIMLLEDMNADSGYEVNFDNEVDRFKRWISERLEWVDANIEKIVPETSVIRLLADGEEYAVVSLDREGYLNGANLPADPVKEGYTFMGWYRTDEEGEEVRLAGNRYYDMQQETYIYYAKWQEGTPEEIIKDIRFAQDTYYFPISYEEDFEDSGWALDLVVLPFDLDAGDVTWTVDNESLASVSSDGRIRMLAEGEVTVTASYLGKTASCKVIGMNWEQVDGMKEFSVDPKLSVVKGEYAQIKISYKPEQNIIIRPSYFRYVVMDESILEVNDYGFVYGKKNGSTIVLVYYEDLGKIQACQVEVTDAPDDGSSTDQEKSASRAKLKTARKTVKPGKTYQIRVQKTDGQKVRFLISKKAKKNGILVGKTSGKIKVSKKAKAGTYPVKVVVKASRKYKAKTLTFQLKVKK